MIGPIHHVTLSVRNLEASIAFYRDVLGFRCTLTGEVDDHEHEHYLRLNPGTTGRVAVMQSRVDTASTITGAVELVQWTPSLPDTGPKRPGDPGVCLLAFEVHEEELDRVHGRIVAAGVECWSEPITMSIDGYGDITAVVFEDPDGVMIELLTLPSLEAAREARRRWIESRREH